MLPCNMIRSRQPRPAISSSPRRLPLSPFPVSRTFFRLTPTPHPSPLRPFSTHPSQLDTPVPPQPLCYQSHPHAFRHTWGCASVFSFDFELLTPNRSFRTCPHQYHSAPLSRPLFSYSYALFCHVQNANSRILNHLRTLCRKHPGWGESHLRANGYATRLQFAKCVIFDGKGTCGLIHVVVHGENLIEAVLVRINVDHPAEDNRVKASAGCGTGVFRGDGAVQPELRPVSGAKLLARRHAEIRVQVPHGHAKRHAGIQLVFGGALGHGVHRADKLIAGGGFFVEQGSRARGIEGEGFEKAVAITGEVILGLRDVWQEYFEAVIESDVVVLVLFDARAKLSDDFVGALNVFRPLWPHGRHEHMKVVRVVMARGHVLD